MQNKNSVNHPWTRLFLRLENLWEKITDPLFVPDSIRARRKSQLIASLLFIYSLLALVRTIVSTPGTSRFVFISFLFTAVLYFFSRTRHYKTVIYTTLLLLTIYQYWIIFAKEQASPFETEALLIRQVAIFLLGVSLLGLHENIILIAANLIAIALLPVFLKDVPPTTVLSSLGFILTCGAIIIANIRYRDISEQDRRTELLGEKKFSDDIINSLPGIFFMYDTDGRLVRWNKKHEEAAGYTAEELAGMHHGGLMRPVGREMAKSWMQNAGKVETEINLITKNGDMIPFYVTMLGNAFGEKNYSIGFGIDITELKRTEEAHRAVVENSLQGLAIYQKGRIVFANPAYAQTLGYFVDELYKMTPEQAANLIFVEDRRLLNMRMQAASSGEEVSPRYETRIVRKDGSLRWLDVTMSVISYRNQPAIQAANVDITDRKLMEAEQARLIWELEAKNAELERFTYTVSHDLKSPLITIRGFLGFLEKDLASNNPPRWKADVQRISEATEKMQNLLNDLLRLSRVGRVTNPPENVSFRAIAYKATELAGGQIRARGVEVKIEKDMPEVRVDRERIVEVVQNLLDNAVKFMGAQSRPRIEIGADGYDHGEAVLYVRDNGIGIDSQFHGRIFGLFNKLNPNIDGTGVGLALVKRIIEFHNGHIWVKSEPGKGSTFYFTLPIPNKG